MSETPKNSSGKKESAAKKESKKPGLFSKIGKFFREYRSELKKISWPTFGEVVKNTAITLIVVAMVGVIIWLADLGLNQLRTVLLNAADAKAAEVVSESGVTESDLQNLLDSVSGADYLSSSDSGIASGSDVSATDAE